MPAISLTTMINTQIRIHDKFSVEFKIGFYTSAKEKNIDKFKINTWIFVPNSLNINRFTYTKEQFYSDMRSNVRLITPAYSLNDLYRQDNTPFRLLTDSIDRLLSGADEVAQEDYVHQVKMLMSILKSTYRNNCNTILYCEDKDRLPELIRSFSDKVAAINTHFRSIRDMILDTPDLTTELKEYICFGDEYLCFITEENAYRLMKGTQTHPDKQEIKSTLSSLIRGEDDNRVKMHYSMPDLHDQEHNSLILIKKSLLKKFVESDLYLHRVKKADGAVAHEVYYSLAAGIAMVFATVVSFIATQRFGNFSSTLFIVLVISYMFKDRIKDFIRFYFSSKLDQRYFDWRWRVSLRERKIGIIKEGFDFISQHKVPEMIQKLRNKTPLVKAETQVYDEKVILYRKRLSLQKKVLDAYKEYPLSGVNDILRLNLMSFTKQMDNPSIPIDLPDEKDGFKTIMGRRVYAIYLVLECNSEEETYYKKYRLLLNRNGISDVSEI